MEKKVSPMKYAEECILYYILKNNLKPGDKLPSERDLSEKFTINRTTLRSAISRLAKQGKLVKTNRSGIFVSENKLIRNVQDIESPSQIYNDSQYEFFSKVISLDTLMANKILSKKLEVPLGTDVTALKRLRILDGEPIILETSFIKSEIFDKIRDRNFENNSLYSALSDIGFPIAKGKENIEVGLPQKQEKEILQLNDEQLIFIIRGTAQDGENRPVEYFNSFVRGDKVKFLTCLK